ncbi:hypothetical protein Zm00014a_021693 [Zea mays]|uniref:Uncharacterized protein n=1 Tax=Zea mays TaxID=4577 RepID=A0A317YKK5_MAIZE|nr:hypothetical protein Zm00014a_021693 [Zea mays]
MCKGLNSLLSLVA